MNLARFIRTQFIDDVQMTRIDARFARHAALLPVILFAIGACGDKSKHATDGDTGAAAPATVRDMSATPNAGDSTVGVSNATGQPSSAGDTLGARARDSSKGSNAGSPAGSSTGTRP
jgi:hypothetical protein